MLSEKQLEANRLDALKIHRPAWTDGKAASSLNAVETGIDSQAELIPSEDAAKLEAPESHHSRTALSGGPPHRRRVAAAPPSAAPRPPSRCTS
jgi:hypothetical protein